MKPLSLWLTQQRKLRKLSKSELARHLNKPISYVHEVEQSRYTLELVEFVKYCHALNTDPKILPLKLSKMSYQVIPVRKKRYFLKMRILIDSLLYQVQTCLRVDF